jgi:hypothetical protein
MWSTITTPIQVCLRQSSIARSWRRLTWVQRAGIVLLLVGLWQVVAPAGYDPGGWLEDGGLYGQWFFGMLGVHMEPLLNPLKWLAGLWSGLWNSLQTGPSRLATQVQAEWYRAEMEARFPMRGSVGGFWGSPASSSDDLWMSPPMLPSRFGTDRKGSVMKGTFRVAFCWTSFFTESRMTLLHAGGAFILFLLYNLARAYIRDCKRSMRRRRSHTDADDMMEEFARSAVDVILRNNTSTFSTAASSADPRASDRRAPRHDRGGRGYVAPTPQRRQRWDGRSVFA